MEACSCSLSTDLQVVDLVWVYVYVSLKAPTGHNPGEIHGEGQPLKKIKLEFVTK